MGRLLLALAVLLTAAPASAAEAARDSKLPRTPNVVLIILDDMNDYVGHLGGHPQTQTPNIDSLAEQSFVFTNAHSNVPVCAPARASMFSGIYAHNSKNYGFAKWFENPVLGNSKTLMEYFGENGYDTLGTGKVMHHLKRDQWTRFGPGPDYGPVWFDGEQKTAHPSVPKPFADIGPIDGSFAAMTAEFVIPDDERFVGWYQGGWQNPRPMRYRSDEDRDRLPDEISADWAVHQLETRAASDTDKPFFLAVGLIKPHTPLHVPKHYFDRFPEDAIELPRLEENDRKDTYYHGLFGKDFKGPRYYRTLEQSYAEVEEGLRTWTRAYLAATSFVDEQVGKVLDAIETSPFRDNTIVVLTSDHGFTIGEKEYLFKNSLWESSTRVPLLIHIPGREPAVMAAPVSHIDLYPTLRELAGLVGETRKNAEGHELDGTSLAAYMRGNTSRAPDYALTMIQADTDSKNPRDMHYSLRSEKFRYVRYASGDEELYDHHRWTTIKGTARLHDGLDPVFQVLDRSGHGIDPNEHNNLAGDARYDSVRQDMRRALDRFFE